MAGLRRRPRRRACETLELLGCALAATDDRLLAGDIVRRLDSRLRDVLRMPFELDLGQRVIADRVGASQMHVSRTLGHLTPARPTG